MEIGIRGRRKRKARLKVVMCVLQVARLAVESVAVPGVMMENLCTEECKDGRGGKDKGAT